MYKYIAADRQTGTIMGNLEDNNMGVYACWFEQPEYFHAVLRYKVAEQERIFVLAAKM